jgi:hypothetical protein
MPGVGQPHADPVMLVEPVVDRIPCYAQRRDVDQHFRDVQTGIWRQMIMTEHAQGGYTGNLPTDLLRQRNDAVPHLLPVQRVISPGRVKRC